MLYVLVVIPFNTIHNYFVENTKLLNMTDWGSISKITHLRASFTEDITIIESKRKDIWWGAKTAYKVVNLKKLRTKVGNKSQTNKKYITTFSIRVAKQMARVSIQNSFSESDSKR